MSIVNQVQLILNDTGVFWPVQTVLDAVNEAQFHIYSETKFAITTADMSLGNGVDIVEIPPTILVPKWIEGVNSNFAPPVRKRFFPSTMRNLEHFLRTWRGNNLGQPMFFVVWDATHWRCFPRPDALGSGPGGVYPFTIYGIGFPQEIVDVSADLVGPSNYIQAVQNYSASLLFEATRPDLADFYMNKAMEQVLNFKKRLRNNQSHNIRTLRPATTQLELQQGGAISELPQYYPLEGQV